MFLLSYNILSKQNIKIKREIGKYDEYEYYYKL